MASGSEPPIAASRDDVPPMLPGRGAFLLAFAGVVVAGALGGVIGYGICDIMFASDVAALAGAVVGALSAAAGVGIVAVLVLRAMSEWRRAGDARAQAAKTNRRNASA